MSRALHAWRKFRWVFLLVTVVGSLLLGYASADGAALLSARLELARVQVEDVEEILAHPPGSILGARPQPGNAVDDYLQVIWVLGSRQGPPPPLSFDMQAMVESTPGRLREFAPAVFRELEAAIYEGAPVTSRLVTHVETYNPTTRLVREGLAKSGCDWDYSLSHGMLAPLPDLLALRAAAWLMLYEAHNEADPARGVRTGLEVVALGDDVARHPTLIAAMIAEAVRAMGLRFLTTLMGRTELPAEAYHRVRDSLGRRHIPWDHVDVLEWDHLGVALAFLAAAGYHLDPGDPAPNMNRGPVWSGDLWSGYWELEAFEAFHERYMAAIAGPPELRASAYDLVDDDLIASWTILCKLQLPIILPGANYMRDGQALRQAARVLAASHLYRLEHGAFPAALSLLDERLQRDAVDPHASGGELLKLVLTPEGELKCYSVGADVKDGGGSVLGNSAPKGDSDVGFSTEDPR